MYVAFLGTSLIPYIIFSTSWYSSQLSLVHQDRPRLASSQEVLELKVDVRIINLPPCWLHEDQPAIESPKAKSSIEKSKNIK